MTITPKHLNDICLLGSKTGECRYLRNDELDSAKWYCQKLQLAAKAKIDVELKIASNKFSAPPPSGDNCPGLPLLKHVQQGYDLD
jgi:hypothetical protein